PFSNSRVAVTVPFSGTSDFTVTFFSNQLVEVTPFVVEQPVKAANANKVKSFFIFIYRYNYSLHCLNLPEQILLRLWKPFPIVPEVMRFLHRSSCPIRNLPVALF